MLSSRLKQGCFAFILTCAWWNTTPSKPLCSSTCSLLYTQALPSPSTDSVPQPRSGCRVQPAGVCRGTFPPLAGLHSHSFLLGCTGTSSEKHTDLDQHLKSSQVHPWDPGTLLGLPCRKGRRCGPGKTPAAVSGLSKLVAGGHHRSSTAAPGSSRHWQSPGLVTTVPSGRRVTATAWFACRHVFLTPL